MLSFGFELQNGPLKTLVVWALIAGTMTVGAFLFGTAKASRAALPQGVGALFIIGSLWIGGEGGGRALFWSAAVLGAIVYRASYRRVQRDPERYGFREIR